MKDATEKNLTVVKTCKIMGVAAQIYGGEGEVWMTRKAIGEMLEYADPQKAIDTLHSRNKDRLDKYSVTLKLRGTDNKVYETVLYSAKGVYEICRWSRQPKADEFYDKIYDILEAVRKKGFYGQLSRTDAMEMCYKHKISVEDYCKYRTGKEFEDYVEDKAKMLRSGKKEKPNNEKYIYTIDGIAKESGLAKDIIAGLIFHNKIDKQKEACKWLDDGSGWRLTWFGRMLLNNVLPNGAKSLY